ncbi:MAG: hypothetical protein WBM76_17645 [Woeseiaceae bacterium]
MTTLTGRNTRTIVGHVVTLLDYPRWIIEREVDFTNCHLGGSFDVGDTECSTCRFGAACCWLNTNRSASPTDASLDELLHALATSIEFLRSSKNSVASHSADCDCETCDWLHQSKAFLRQYRHKT